MDHGEGGVDRSMEFDRIYIEHKQGRIPSHKASQKLSIDCFGSKLDPSSICDYTTGHSQTQKRPNTDPEGVPEVFDWKFR